MLWCLLLLETPWNVRWPGSWSMRAFLKVYFKLCAIEVKFSSKLTFSVNAYPNQRWLNFNTTFVKCKRVMIEGALFLYNLINMPFSCPSDKYPRLVGFLRHFPGPDKVLFSSNLFSCSCKIKGFWAYADVWTSVVYFYGINRIEIRWLSLNLQL